MQLAKTFVLAIACACSCASALSPECQELWNLPSGEVCGSNGRTYNNYCEVEYDSNKTNDTSLVVAYNGTCTSNTSGSSDSSSSSSSETVVANSSNASTNAPPSALRSDAAENGHSALWAIATSALAAVTFAALV